MEWIISKTLGALLLPPGILLLVLLLALVLTWRRPRVARGLVLLTFLLLYAFSTSFVAGRLLGLLEDEPRDPAADRKSTRLNSSHRL